MRHRATTTVLACLVLLLVGADGAPPPPAHPLRDCTLYTEATPDELRVLAFRFERLFDEYQSEFAGFPKKLTHKPGIYLAPRGGGGVSKGRNIYLHGSGADAAARAHWGGMQHELLHQFVRACVGNVPRWANEGLASYHARFGDSGVRYHRGLLGPNDIADVRRMLADQKQPPFQQYFCVPAPREMKQNYLRNWSLVHFLMHDDGAYRGKFWATLRAVSGGAKWWDAWNESFGDAAALEAAYRRYWMTLPDDAADAGQAEVRVEALTLALADAYRQGQRFTTFAPFAGAVKNGRLKRAAEDWRPTTFVDAPLAWAGENGRWSIERGDPPTLSVLLDNGTRLAGTFDLQRSGPGSVRVTITPKAAAAAATSRPSKATAADTGDDEHDDEPTD